MCCQYKNSGLKSFKPGFRYSIINELYKNQQKVVKTDRTEQAKKYLTIIAIYDKIYNWIYIELFAAEPQHREE